MLKEITMFIVSLGLGPPWQCDIDLFAGHVPVKNRDGDDTPERYLAILENAGGAVLTNVGGVVTPTPPSKLGDSTYWPKYIEKAVQLLNRAKSYFVARDDAEELFDALHNTGGWNLPPVAIGKTNITPRPLADSATPTTLRDVSVFTIDDEFNGCYVSIVSGTGTDNGFVQITDTISASGDIVVALWPGTQPDNTSRYIIGRRFLAIVIDAYGPPAPIENPGERGLFLFSTNYVWKIEEAS
ncbi:hypothetical protein ES703_01269 [subsurface metagenome]